MLFRPITLHRAWRPRWHRSYSPVLFRRIRLYRSWQPHRHWFMGNTGPSLIESCTYFQGPRRSMAQDSAHFTVLGGYLGNGSWPLGLNHNRGPHLIRGLLWSPVGQWHQPNNVLPLALQNVSTGLRHRVARLATRCHE